jgi:hypothetical protein
MTMPRCMQTAGGSAILSHLKRFGFSWRRSKALLPVDNDQMILGAWQLRDADRMVPQYLGRDVRWIAQDRRMMTLTPGTWLNNPAKSLSVDTSIRY